MSFAPLGEIAKIPKIIADKVVSTVVNTVSAKIGDYVAQNFSLPSGADKAVELVNKLNLNGQAGTFKNLAIDVTGAGLPTINSPTSQGAVDVPSYSDATGDMTDKLRVKITQLQEVGSTINSLIFTVMPRIDESGQVDYESISPIQHPGAIQKYKHTSARSWQVSGRLIARNASEAALNLEIINMIRSWRMPFYGQGTGNDAAMAGKLGAPPPLLKLEAYGPQMIGPVVCVLTNYSWVFDNTVDFVPTGENMIPVIHDISLSLTESFSPAEYSGFDLAKFKEGDLSSTGAFTAIARDTQPKNSGQTAYDDGQREYQPGE